jgi:L-aspartate oxidase
MRSSQRQIVIIGSGIAGLYAALKLADTGKEVLLVTKSVLRESNSRYAQGGIVGVLPDNIFDSVDLHVKDTLKAGAGLTDPEVAKFISENSADVIYDLINYGVRFDKDTNDKIALTLEAAHSDRRILHSGGDATGRSIEIALSDKVESKPNITIYQKTQAVDLLVDSDNVCKGIIVFDTETQEYETIYASSVVIASGGVGQVYSNTTNPKIATGDGIAISYRAGAVIQDMEFIQFHPTALTVKGNDTRFLISESVRGEGARLKNLEGEYFTPKYDERGDLAPRDVVTRAIFFEMQKTGDPYVLLDTSIIDSNKLRERFPNIIKACEENGIDILNGAIPVSPAAHYAMGGIKISLEGKTSIPNLFAVGEAGCSSLHGANRLASNSLLECLVTSREAASYLNDKDLEVSTDNDSRIECIINQYEKPQPIAKQDIQESLKHLRKLMWDKAGIVRNEKKLSEALEEICRLKKEFDHEYECANLEEYEYRNLLVIAELIVKSALARKESRGAHYREDYQETQKQAYHSYIKKGEIWSQNVLSAS